MGPLESRARKLLSLLGAPTFPAAGDLPRGTLALVYGVRVAFQVSRQTVRDRIPRQAASLAFQSLLSAVPLAVIVLSLLSRFVSSREIGELTAWLGRHMLPSRARSIAPALQRLASDVDVHALGVAGAVGLFVVGVILFMNVFAVVDDIWRVRRVRPLTYRIGAALILLVATPLLIAASVYFAQRFVRLPRSVDFFIPLGLTVLGLWAAYKGLPSARVRALPAGVAALCVGALLEAGKTGFSFYVAEMEVSVSGLYGAIGFVPLALVWLYVSWVIFLFGVELTFTLQNFRFLWLRDAHLDRSPTGTTAGAALAVRVLTEAYRAGSISVANLAVALQAAPQAVDLVVDHLAAGSLVDLDKDRAVTPSRPPTEVAVAEVLGLYAEARPERASGSYERLEILLDRIEAAREREAEGLTMADLI